MRKLIQQYAKDLTAGRLASGYEHSYRVYHLGRQIGDGLEFDDEVLHAACFLHDIEMSSNHPAGSAEKARAILEETGFEAGKVELVCQAILHHMPGSEKDSESLETRLLHDANLLDTLGAVGFARLAIASFLWLHYKTMAEVRELVERWLAHAERFYFPRSRELAAEKVRFTRAAVAALAAETVP